MKPRKTYDTKVKYLVKQGLLPERYKQQIHRSLICKWKQQPVEKYIGHELNVGIEELYEVLKTVTENEKLQKIIRSYYRINKTLRNVIGKGREYVNKIKESKKEIISAIQHAGKVITKKRALKLLGISPRTYRTWAMESYYKCTHSLKKICSSNYPQQLTIKEIKKMHRMLMDKKYLHWPIMSVAYYSAKRSILKAHPNTWYKYSRFMNVQRMILRKIRSRCRKGIKAKRPDQKWHADVTQLRTLNGKLYYIYLVMDNFSRYILSWKVSDKICVKTRLQSFEEAIAKAEVKRTRNGGSVIPRRRTMLIVDGGKENNNRWVDGMIKRYPKSVKKVVAMRDILKSNAMAESVNKIIKYQYLFHKNIKSKRELETYMQSSVMDYNCRRPHGSLLGLTPEESYFGIKVNLKNTKAKIKKIMSERIMWNQSNSCKGCPFECAHG